MTAPAQITNMLQAEQKQHRQRQRHRCRPDRQHKIVCSILYHTTPTCDVQKTFNEKGRTGRKEGRNQRKEMGETQIHQPQTRIETDNRHRKQAHRNRITTQNTKDRIRRRRRRRKTAPVMEWEMECSGLDATVLKWNVRVEVELIVSELIGYSRPRQQVHVHVMLITHHCDFPSRVSPFSRHQCHHRFHFLLVVLHSICHAADLFRLLLLLPAPLS